MKSRWRVWGAAMLLLALAGRAQAAPVLSCLPLDPAVSMLVFKVSMMRMAADGFVSLAAVVATGARLVNIVRAVMVDLFSVAILGDPGSGRTGLLPNLLPMYMLITVVAVMLLGVFMLAQWLTSYRVSSFGRIAGVLFLSAWLANSGGTVMRGYDQLRVAIGSVFYNAARQATASMNLGLASGASVNVNVGECESLSRTNMPGEVPTCAGYGLAMAYLYFRDIDGPLSMRPSADFQAAYFTFKGVNYYTASDTQIGNLGCTADSAALTDLISAGIQRALLAFPLALMGLLEQMIWFLLTLGVLALFISLAINLAFAALTPFGNGLSDTVNQLVQMLVRTASASFYLGLVIGLMLVTAGNVAYFLGAGLLGMAVAAGLMLQTSNATFQSLNAAAGGMAQSGMNAVVGVVGGTAVLRAARNVGGAVSSSSIGRYAGQTTASMLKGATDELGLRSPIPDAATLGRNIGGGAVAVLTGHAGDSQGAQQRRIVTAEREAERQARNLARGPSWREELRVVQQERRQDIRRSVQQHLRGEADAPDGLRLDDDAGEVAELPGGETRRPLDADAERRRGSDRRGGIDRREAARLAALQPVGTRPAGDPNHVEEQVRARQVKLDANAGPAQDGVGSERSAEPADFAPVRLPVSVSGLAAVPAQSQNEGEQPGQASQPQKRRWPLSWLWDDAGVGRDISGLSGKAAGNSLSADADGQSELAPSAAAQFGGPVNLSGLAALPLLACPKCGRATRFGAKFCGYCQAPIADGVGAASTGVAASAGSQDSGAALADLGLSGVPARAPGHADATDLPSTPLAGPGDLRNGQQQARRLRTPGPRPADDAQAPGSNQSAFGGEQQRVPGQVAAGAVAKPLASGVASYEPPPGQPDVSPQLMFGHHLWARARTPVSGADADLTTLPGVVSDRPWLPPARAALEAAQNNGDPARAWEAAAGDSPGSMTGQIRALALRSVEAGLTADVFVDVLIDVLRPGSEAWLMEFVEPYFLGPSSAKTYLQQARRVARWAEGLTESRRA